MKHRLTGGCWQRIPISEETEVTEELVRTGTLADGAVATATLTREKPLNSLLLDTIDQLTAFMDSVEDSEVRCVLLDSSTPRAFCAGADITALYHAIKAAEDGSVPYAEAFFLREYMLDYRLHQLSLPAVVWGQGIVMGGGLGLLAGCSHRVGTSETRLAMPEVTIGLFPDAGGTHVLSSLPDHLGLFAGLTGCQISAWDAMALGLLDYVVPADAREEFDKGLLNINWTDDNADNHQRVSHLLEGLVSHETARYELLRFRSVIKSLMESALAADDFFQVFEDGLDSLPQDEWLQSAIATYRSGCPVTSRIFLEQMRRARGMSLAERFRMELVIAYQCIRHPDFPEGVRALLIDKDRNPAWSYPDARSVPDDLVEAHFQPAWSGDHPLKL